jgi:hypothetical protein
MSDLTDRLRTLAAFIMSRPHETELQEDVLLRAAADLLIEASNALERVVVAEVAGVPIPMEIIPPQPPSNDVLQKALDTAIIAHFEAPPPPPASPHGRPPSACPQCDSRAAKTVRRDGNRLMLTCPVCSSEWQYKPVAKWV